MCKFTIPQVDANATNDERRKAYFDALFSTDLSEEVEKKNGLTYISWSQSWKVFKMFYPSATFKIFTNSTNGLPVFESDLGLMVHTAVEADGITYEDWLPVMDYANRSMKSVPYAIQVYDKATKQYVERRIEAATTFDVNAAIQRSLVRATARHGLGLYIYNGLDHLNEEPNAESTKPKRQQASIKPTQQKPQAQQQPTVNPHASLIEKINSTNDVASLVSIYLDNTQVIEANSELKSLLTNRKKALQTLNAA